VRRIAERYMRSPEEICIAKRTCSADTVKQSALTVGPHFKLEALTRILEAESFDAVIVFVRTKLQTTELADKLVSRGYDAAPLSGDLKQSARERTIEQLKSGKLDIIVATDVAARGLDVERLSLVVNYDMPYDPEDYIHRIGRTGRAGREGRAILFSTPREFKLLKAIERATHRQIDEYELPTVGSIRAKRIADLKNKILEASTALDPEETALFSSLIKQFQVEAQADAVHIAVALLKLVQAEKPLLVKECERPAPQRRDYRDDRGGYRGKGDFKPKGKWRHDDGPKREPWKERRFNKKGNGGPSQQSKRQDVFE
jgi:ATP-dependent RNA helicase DeaD